jgi:hypothetical protein
MNHRTTQRRGPRGVSLMEVLISIFVLSMGLLGLISLLPVAGFQAADAARFDRSASVGRAALNQVKTSGMLRRENWATNVDRGNPFVIDPLGGTGDFAGSIPRITLRAYPGADSNMSAAVAKQIFSSRDDLNFVLPEDGDDPAEQMFIPSDGSRKKRSANSRFSWCVTVFPSRGQHGLGTNADNLLYRVAVVVFHNRDTSGERRINLLSKAINVSGEVLLFSSDTNHTRGMKKGQWILLTSQQDNPRTCQWYRVTGTSESAVLSRISLAGPGSNTVWSHAGVFGSIVGVYEYAMRLEDATLWTE